MSNDVPSQRTQEHNPVLTARSSQTLSPGVRVCLDRHFQPLGIVDRALHS
ncbi:hypothetical protein IQ269_10170 [Tychonema sp. LEGE 07199]|nr:MULTISPECIES: hypothetical protein [unclassified Tychonema]MBE9121174.1 hypothetical protein [Tychonema sp. LEGE 07199]MBE9131903.1 hypothetical protein [Tychonema sp. LEGE 07196]